MVQGETADEFGVRGRPMLHGHNFNHVKVWLGRGSVDGENGIDNIGREFLGEGTVEFRAERRPGNRQEEFSVDRALELELVEELERVKISLVSVTL
jgi:hypothetical protein